MVASLRTLGFTHFQHLEPKQPDYRYPYPDFLQVMYLIEAGEFVPHARIDDGYELDTTFVSLVEARALGLTTHEQVFLDAALEVP